jgi:hypothetical protein
MLLTDLFDLEMEAIMIPFDNQSCMNTIENHVFHDESKHIEIQYHFTHDMMQRGAIKLQCIGTDEQFADVLIKALSRVNFEHFRDNIDIVQKDLPRKGEWCTLYYRILIRSGSSIRISYPSEYFDSWEDPLDLSKYHKMLLSFQPCVVMPASC